MSKKILIIDDDERFLAVLKTALEKDDLHITVCADALGAEHIFMIGNFDAVLCAFSLRGATAGLDLLARFKKEKPAVPFILMTGAPQAPPEAEKLGANGFIAKPFRREALMEILNGFFTQVANNDQNKPASLDEVYMKLNIDDYISGREMKFDIFVRLNSGKYIKIGNEGEYIPIEQILGYKSKGLNYLYLRKADFKKYLDFNLGLATLVVKSTNIDKQKKINFLKHTSELILTKIFVEGNIPESAPESIGVLNSTLSLITEDDDKFRLLESLNSHSDHLYAHSLGVALYSCIIAREFSYHSLTTISKLCMAGLFHDIGKKEIDPRILKSRYQNPTPEEVRQYETHPTRGLEILSHLREFSSDVIQIILHHHENCIGTGYPMKLNRTKIHPMAKILAVANDFCNYVIDSYHSERISPLEAIDKMLIFPEIYDRLTIKALLSVFNVKAPADLDAKYGISG